MPRICVRNFLLAIFIGMLFQGTAMAEVYRRQISLEFDAVEEATGYEITVQPYSKDPSKEQGAPKKAVSFKSTEPAWSGKLPPGSYKLKMRSLDYRSVPGDWSEEMTFDVALESVKILTPTAGQTIPSEEVKASEVEFKWTPTPGAHRYVLQVTDGEKTFTGTHETTDDHFTLELPVASNYQVNITAFDQSGNASEAAVGEFTLQGAKLPKPKIEKPTSEFVRTIYWEKSENAQSYDTSLFRFDKATKKWIKVSEAKEQPSESLSFDASLPGGQYKVTVTAKSKNRPSSAVAIESFKVRNGDRSPASEFTAEVRKSIERFTGWYGIASYLVTMMNYNGLDWDTGMNPKFSAVGGTGRLGAGWFVEEKKWGFLSILDMSGFYKSDEQKNVTFASLETNAVYKTSVASRGEFRGIMGMFYKEMPYLVPISSGSTSTTASKIGMIGPHLAAEYWHSISPKLGLQVNAHLYYNAMKASTPNGGNLTSTMSTQLGFLGSYRLTQKLTGLMGYARKVDSSKFAATNSLNPAVSSTNEVSITGNYLNFYAEYSF